MKHQDHLSQKSYLINDMKYISIDQQKEWENQKIKEEAKRRLENSLQIERQYNDSQSYMKLKNEKSAFMRAQFIKLKLDNHIKKNQDRERKQFKLPNLDNIVSRNCNNIDKLMFDK
ncbi:UNKNOWN [Stylonychia lemnae]|uniref:Uncharacterized protein n=1 Tax=Stylonychia lemnae TaxID=5949 RepID=A0A078B466_STYLE|nr:UNKNOWN [Stylonychia lemnae]|eukprot:CDW89041.1 UNKNOWN [Stylonychia lemnae]